MASTELPKPLATHARGVEFRAAELRKELGFADLVLATILFVVVPDFFGTAVKAGPAHVALWLLGIALFFVPQALIVARLNKQLPLEGGLYEWARHAFGDLAGFLVAWNLWLFAVLYTASVGLVTTTYVAYALGFDAQAVVSSQWIVLAASVATIAWLMLAAHLGLHIGKWVSNTGSALTVVTVMFLAALPFFRPGGSSASGYHPLHIAAPPLTVFSLSVFSKMTFGALCGLEYAAIFAGESRNPGRHLARAILMAAPLIAVLYIFGTSAILAFVSPEHIDIIGPIPQAFRAAFAHSRFASVIVPVAVLLLFTNYLSSFTLTFSANTRLPMCAGWDHLLPTWFSRLHPRFRTPMNSIFFLAGLTLALSVVVLIGVGEQEAFELLQIWGFAFYGIAYLALFAIPLFTPSRNALSFRALPWLRFLAALGLMVTILFVILSIFPIIQVVSESAYTIKTVVVLLAANLAGYLLYRLRPPRVA